MRAWDWRKHVKYKYYEPIELSEHLYFAEEIYEMFLPILPKDTKAVDIHYIVKKYVRETGCELRKLYYQTSKGLKRVYPVEVALDAITYHVSNMNIKIKEIKIWTLNKE